jgi:hypothetical protein
MKIGPHRAKNYVKTSSFPVLITLPNNAHRYAATENLNTA